MRRIIIVSLLIFSGLVIFTKGFARAEENVCSEGDPSGCSAKIDEYRAKLDQLRTQKNTLSNKIASYNNQIQLTILQIQQTEIQISSLTGQITDLEGRLSHLSDLFRRRTIEGYRVAVEMEPLTALLASDNLSSFVTQVEYLRTVRENDRRLMLQVEETRSNYDGQRTLAQLLAKRLEAQKTKLGQLKTESANLLRATENDEKKYQQLLAQAQAELAAFRRFISLQGGASILSNQTHCDDWGCYYNQRDSQWASMPLGNSGLPMAEFGCLVTSAAMIAKHYGRNISPLDIATEPAAFFSPDSGTALLWIRITVKGVTVERTSIGVSLGNIDRELQAGRPVIVGLFSGPGHFVVIKSGSNGNYTMNDPFVENGHDISFTSKYRLGDITDVERVTVN